MKNSGKKNNNNTNINNEKKVKIKTANKIMDPPPEKEENYINIDTKHQFELYNSDISKKKLEEIINYIRENIDKNTPKKGLFQNYLNQKFSEKTTFLIIKNISKKITKAKKLNDKIISQILDTLDLKLSEWKRNKKIYFHNETIETIGYIIAYALSKIEDYKITDDESYQKKVDEYKSKRIDMRLKYFNKLCEIHKTPDIISKMQYFAKYHKKDPDFIVPGELCFLLTLIAGSDQIIINMDLEINKTLDNDNLNLYLITFLNLPILINNAKSVEFNFTNKKLQGDLYKYYNEEFEKRSNFKFNKKSFGLKDYDKVWDFNSDLNEKNNCYFVNENKTNYFIETDEKSSIKKINFYCRKEKCLDVVDDTDEFICIEKTTYTKKGKPSFYFVNKNNKAILINNKGTDSVDSKSKNQLQFLNELTFETEQVIEDKIGIILSKNQKIIESIYIGIQSILNFPDIQKLGFIINYSYNVEFYKYLQKFFNPNSVVKTFHILDDFIDSFAKLNSFNIEFNCFDYLTFYKVLTILNDIKNLTSVNISFFCCPITFSKELLFRLYLQLNEEKKIGMGSFERNFMNEMIVYLAENLEVLFQILKDKKKTLVDLGFGFEPPDIIGSNKKYFILIMKFLLNIFFLIDDEETNVKNLILIAPRIQFDCSTLPELDNILDGIDIYRNKKLERLYLDSQFKKINNIKNIISKSLMILTIGKLDIFTLKSLTKYLISYNFYCDSSLTMLNINLLESIMNLNLELTCTLYNLFNIKTKSLQSITLFTNLSIKDRKFLFKLLDHNWIQNIRIKLNVNSKNDWKNIVKIPQPKYLLYRELEVNSEKNNSNKNKSNAQIKQFYQERILNFKLILLNKKQKKKIVYSQMKKIIFDILKYLYIAQDTKIEIFFS